jgi:hypothetical protein
VYSFIVKSLFLIGFYFMPFSVPTLEPITPSPTRNPVEPPTTPAPTVCEERLFFFTSGICTNELYIADAMAYGEFAFRI